MAHFYVRNSLNSSKAVKINISFVRGYDIGANDGDPRWFLELATTHKAEDGTRIPPQYVNNVEDKTKIDELIADAVATIASYVDWSPLEEDKEAPYVYDIFPSMSTGSVPLESNVDITLKDTMVSSGMDLSEAVITISTNGITFDITDDCTIRGTPFEYIVHWEPPGREYKYYGG